MTAMFM